MGCWIPLNFLISISLGSESYALLKSKKTNSAVSCLQFFLLCFNSNPLLISWLILVDVDHFFMKPLWSLLNFGDSVAVSRMCRIQSLNSFVTAGRTLIGLVFSIFIVSAPSLLNRISLACMKYVGACHFLTYSKSVFWFYFWWILSLLSWTADQVYNLDPSISLMIIAGLLYLFLIGNQKFHLILLLRMLEHRQRVY